MIELSRMDLARALYKGYVNTDLDKADEESYKAVYSGPKRQVDIKNAQYTLKARIQQHLINATEDPVVVLFSGGVDSTLMLLTLLSLRSTKNVRCVSIGYKNHLLDQSFLASQICKKLMVKHDIVYLDKNSIDQMMDAITPDNYQDFFISSSLVPTYHAIKYAKDYANIILTGDGGDELFCGYDRYLFANKLMKLAGSKIFKNWDFKSNRFNKVKRFFKGDFRDLVSIWEVDDISRTLSLSYDEHMQLEKENLFGFKLEEFDSKLHPMEKMMLFDTLTELYGVETRKVNTAARMVGFKGKLISPFLANDIQNYSISLPMNFKYNSLTGTRKVLLRNIIKNEFSKYNKMAGKSKKGFAFPIGDWLGTEYNIPDFCFHDDCIDAKSECKWTINLLDNLTKKGVMKVNG